MENSNDIHLVGSIPYSSSAEVFSEVSKQLGSHLCRIPDGETGDRTNWVAWQLPKILDNPSLVQAQATDDEYTQTKKVTLAPGHKADSLALADLGYAGAAINSYEEFSKMQIEGAIPQHCRFQVCLPTPVAVTHLYIAQDLQAEFEQVYERALLAELNLICTSIPNEKLSIQWDTAVESALLEGVMPTYMTKPMSYISTFANPKICRC